MDLTSYCAPVRTLPESLEGVAIARFYDGLLELYASMEDEIAADPAASRQAYTRLVVEVASESSAPEDARAFAQHFTSKGNPYTESKNGMAALLLETWLAKHGGKLFGQFVETILDTNTRTFVAIFMGALDKDVMEGMKIETEKFIQSWESLVQYDDRDYEEGRISDVTIYECTAGTAPKQTGAEKPSTARLQRGVPGMQGQAATPPTDGSASYYGEGLLPQTRTEYERVLAEGGLTQDAVPLVFGVSPFGDVRVEDDLFLITDPNDVVWESADRGRIWVPRMPDVEGEVYGASEEAPDAVETDVEEDETPLVGAVYGDLDADARQFEEGEAGAVRSHYGSWVVVESPVDGPDARLTSVIVGVQDRVWAVPVELEELTDAILRIDVMYADLPEECDAMVEAFLGEYAEDHGTRVVQDAAAVRALYESEENRTARDATIAEHSENRVAEMASSLLPLKGELNRWLRAKLDSTKVTLASAKAHIASTRWARRLNPTDKDILKVLKAIGGRKKGDEFVFEAAASEPTGIQDEPTTPEGDEDEPGTTDRTERPAYYRDDLQKYFDLQKVLDKDDNESLAAVRRKFKIAKRKKLTVTPTGEVRLPGVVDDPELAKAAPAPLGTQPPPPLIEPPLPPEQASAGLPGSTGASGASKPKATAEAVGDVGEPVPVETLDDAFLYFATYVDDAYLTDFGSWVEAHVPHLVGALAGWHPTAAPLQEDRTDLALVRGLVQGGTGQTSTSKSKRHLERQRERKVFKVDEANQARYERWKRLTNLSLSALLEFHRSDAFASAFKKGSDRRLACESAKQLVRMKRTPVAEWDETMWNWCGRQTKYIARLRTAPGRLSEGGKLTRKFLALKAWGHNPAVRESVSEGEIFEAMKAEVDAQIIAEVYQGLHRMIDSLPGPGPHEVLADGADAGPKIRTLKKNKGALTDEERSVVMDAGAIWHHGPKGEATPAVWKSQVGEQTWYVVSSNRAFRSAKTLDGAVKHYPAIKATA